MRPKAVLVGSIGIASAAGITAAVGLVLASGVSTPAEHADPSPERAIELSRASATAPADFTVGRPFASCGAIALGHGAAIPLAARDCLMSGSGARELAIARPTVEGDPIVVFFRAGPSIDGLDVFTNMTYDRFGTPGWARERCATTRVDEFGACNRT